MTFKPIGSTAQTVTDESRNVGGGSAGETGSALSLHNSSEIAAWLSRHAPGDMDKAAVSRASSHGVALTVREELRFPSGPNGERLPCYSVVVGCDAAGGPEQREAARRDLERFMTPAPTRVLEGWIAELSVITAGRNRENVDAELLVTAYASRLSKYPADVARFSLIETTWKWFPTWAELERVCDAKASSRRAMLRALSMPESEPEPLRRPPTQEERDRTQAMVDEMFPHVPRVRREAAVGEALAGNCMKDGAV